MICRRSGDDVLIVGAGPAGSIAALVLARAGVRVRLIDRATFPRDKLCGDTVNPGTLAALRRLDSLGEIERQGLPIAGMRLTGPAGAVVESRYPAPGRSLLRRDLDLMLLERAVAAGAAFDPGVRALGAVLEDGIVRAVRVHVAGGERRLDAPVTIAADGRRSTLAFGLGLTRHPAAPRRWAVGAYFDGVSDIADVGEMHVRRGHYLGIAPLPNGLANVCVVTTTEPERGELSDAAGFIARSIAADSALRDRFAASRRLTEPVVLGPLAVSAASRGVDGLLLAGDAAGFIDPMTGDGLRFAIRGGELASSAALDALAHGWVGVHRRHFGARRAEFGAKWRFNRSLRQLVSAPRAVTAAAYASRVVPSIMRAVIRKAGDCDRS